VSKSGNAGLLKSLYLPTLAAADVTRALDESLSAGGSLTRILRGAAAATPEG
jgi:hypothetical protein